MSITVLTDDSPDPPWILFNPHKDGTPSRDCGNRNNLAAAITATGDTVADHNLLITDRNALFVDPARFDFHLHPYAHGAIDTGSYLLAPSVDLDGEPRPNGIGIDPGYDES